MPSLVVRTAPEFERELRQLKRRFPTASSQVRNLILQLQNGELPGDRVPGMFIQTYKVRLPNPSAGRGKRGGMRVCYVVYQRHTVFLLTIYSKTDKGDVSNYELQQRFIQIERKLSID